MADTQEFGIAALTELALNLRWAWHRGTHELWAQLEPDLWAPRRVAESRYPSSH